jgi:acetyltransferase-like isoleucine patch superfamily enzyme
MVQFFLFAKNGFLKIGGREIEKHCCIVNSFVEVYSRVEIGKDCLIASNVHITDCNWHYVEYDGVPVEAQSDVIIGDHVWICPESTILKGSIIGSGSIVGRRSLLSGKVYPANSLIVGMPAKAVKNNCNWKLDLQQQDSSEEPEINKADSL